MTNFGLNRVVLSDGTSTGLSASANLTFDGATLKIISTASATSPLMTVSGTSSNDLVRITQTGTGNSFVVEDSASPDSTPFVIDGNGNIGAGISSNASYKLYAYFPTGTGIRADGSAQGIYALGANDNGTIGAYGVAQDNGAPLVSSIFIGGKFLAGGASGFNYSTQLQDGTEGVNKVLVSQTADGKANWSNTLTGLISVSASTISATAINGTRMTLSGTFSGTTSNNFIQSDLMVQSMLLYLSNNT